jgi:hypothetical protein
MARVLVTGSRDWRDRRVVEAALLNCRVEAFLAGAGGIVVVHGGCPTGADSIAGAVARGHGWPVEVWPADWARLSRAAGPRRNAEMVAAGAAVCLAFPLGRSAGTRDCMRRAERAGIPVRVFEGAPR